jgi:hypothetical protein
MGLWVEKQGKRIKNLALLKCTPATNQQATFLP